MSETKIAKLTANLDKTVDDVLKGHIELARAKQYFNGVGKILGTIKVQQAQQALHLAYKTHDLDLPNIPYLGDQKCLPK